MRRGAVYWALHRISGVLLVAGMAVHFYVMHFGSATALTQASVLARLGQPRWIVFNFALLALVVYHGLYGIMGIVREYVSTERFVIHSRSALIASGAVLLGYGLFILVP